MATEIQGNDIIVRVREVGESEWLQLVCEIDESIEHTNDVSETDTKCGTFNGVKEMKGNYTGNAVCNASPTSGECSYNQILQWQADREPIEILIENEAFTAESGDSVAEGEAVHIFATGKFVASTLTAQTGEVVQFSWTFRPTGTPVIDGSSS